MAPSWVGEKVSLLERELEGYCRRETHSEARVEQAHEDAVFLVGNDDGDALRGGWLAPLSGDCGV